MPGDDARKCRFCGDPIPESEGNALYCRPSHRGAFSRRKRKLDDEELAGALSAGEQAEKIALGLVRENLAPVVREALTEDVLAGIRQLIGHVPKAVETAYGLLDSGDEDVRYRAASLIMRHSIGHKQLVPDVNEGAGAEVNVFFGIPRPDRDGTGDDAIEAAVERECDSCGESKPDDQFVGNSDRCLTCHERIRDSAKVVLGDEAIG